MKDKKERRRYALAPCPGYDVERIESWLQDMAKEGWLLEKESCFFGFLCFRRAVPQAMRYRLEPQKPGEGFGDVPDEELRALCLEYGWEYVDCYGQFYIYRSMDAHAVEMNTDLQVQAKALQAGRRSAGYSAILEICLLSNTFFNFFQQPWFNLVSFGLGYHLVMAVAIVWCTIDILHQWLHLERLRKQLKANVPLDHNKPWQEGALWHRLGKVAYAALILVLLGSLLGSCMHSMGQELTDVDQFPGDPPFVTAADLYPEGTYTSERFLSGYNAYQSYASFFAPNIIKWKEYGRILMPDGRQIIGSLIIEYYETRSALVAQGLMEDLMEQALDDRHYTVLTLPDLGVDQIFAYHGVYPTLLIRHGNILIEAAVAMEYEDTYLWEEWAYRMAEMLIDE